jgi:hypothetical protein
MPLPLAAGLGIAIPLGCGVLVFGLHRMSVARRRALKLLNDHGEMLPGKRKSSEAAAPRFKRSRTGGVQADFSRDSAHLGLEARRSGSGVGRASAAGRNDVRLAKMSAREGLTRPARVRAYESLRSMSRRLTGRR